MGLVKCMPLGTKTLVIAGLHKNDLNIVMFPYVESNAQTSLIIKR